MAMLQLKKVHLERDEFELEEIAYALSEAKEEGKIKVFIVHQQVHFLDILRVLSAE